MLSVSLGTVIWTSIAFLIVVFILAKFAWKPILNALNDREEGIKDALDSAEKARREMENFGKVEKRALHSKISSQQPFKGPFFMTLKFLISSFSSFFMYVRQITEISNLIGQG